MSIGIRKLLVVAVIAAVLVLTNVGLVVAWLEESGVIPWAKHLRDEYFTGTAITVIVALLILLPSRAVWAVLVRRCRVCDAVVLRRGRYCQACGSRV